MIDHDELRRVIAARQDEGRTHWEGCYLARGHGDCAVSKLLGEVERLKLHEDCDLWHECPCYIEGREQGSEHAGARA